MDREPLQRLLDEGVSLAEIGRRHGLHESTVAYWASKHGLQAAAKEKHAAKGALGREELEPLVEAGLSTRQIAEKLDRSQGTVRHWLREYGLKTCSGPGRRPRAGAEAARAAGSASAVLACPRHGEALHLLDTRGSYRCRQCRMDAVVRRRRKVKQILVEEAGGSCRLCGYDRCMAALEFHHLVPDEKRFGLSHRGAARALETVRAEAQKCVLLCSNCHAEVEAGFSTLP